MRVLIADDEAVPRLLLSAALAGWGYDVVAVCDGTAALALLQQPAAPPLAVLDWQMPGLDGPEVVRRLRQLPTEEPPYVILVTGRDAKADVVAGLQAGANDYVVKPFDRSELQARVQVGRTVIELQRRLAERVRQLERAIAQVKQLSGLLPICSYCKKIRDDQNYWQQLDTYVAQHADLQFTHGICPDCFHTVINPQLRDLGLGDVPVS